MSYFYDFLEDTSQDLARTLYEIEDTIYTNPRSMLTHSRAFIEALMEKVMIHENMPNEPLTLIERIQDLNNNGLLTDDVKNALHEVRKLGNAAAHNTRQFRYSESLLAWEHIYTIVKWFVEVYHSYEIEVPEYVDPIIKTEEPYDLGEMVNRFQKIEELLKQSLENEQPKNTNMESKQTEVTEEQEPEIEDTNKEQEIPDESMGQTDSSIPDTSAADDDTESIDVEEKESINMEEEQLWEELNKLNHSEAQIISYHEVNHFILENPSKFVAFLDGLFLKLSHDRMNDLAGYYQTEKLSDSYFTMNSLELGWKMIHLKLKGTREEYEAAQVYCDISEEKFKRDLKAEDAERAFNSLLDIASIWSRDKKNFMNLDKAQNDDPQFESAATVEGEIKEPEQSMTEEKSVEDPRFIKSLNVLRTSSQESVVHSNSFGSFREYMHVERPIQIKFEQVLTEVQQKEDSQLILLCGSVGDGKSHLLAYMKEQRPELTKNVMDHNDSTESFNPEENSLDTLEYILKKFDDDQGKADGQHTVIAINLGVLHNFYTRQRQQGRFNALCDFIDSTGVFDSSKATVENQGNFHMLNFAEEQPYLLTENGAQSPFFLDLMNKVTSPTTENPFYNAWKSDIEQGYQSIAHENYLLLQNRTVQESIVQSLIESIVKQKVFISTRDFYNFLYEIIVPVSMEATSLGTTFNTKDMLPNLMYSHPDRSQLLDALHQNDPLKTRSKEIDQLNTEFVLSISPKDYIREKLGESSLVGAWKEVDKKFDDEQIEYTRLLIRHHELIYKHAYDEYYQQFIWYLYSYYRGNASELGKLFDLIRDVVFKWNGSPKDNYIYINSATEIFRLAVEIQIEPEIDENIFGSANEEEISRFTPSINLGFSQNDKRFLFELDYQLFVLLKRISEGYRPNLQELQDALQFSEHHDQLIKSADKTKELLIVYGEEGSTLKVKEQPRFAKTKFQVEKVNEQ